MWLWLLLAFSGYNVTWQSASGQTALTYQALAVVPTALGPFASKSDLWGPNDPPAYASTWQYALNFPTNIYTGTPFTFSFFGQPVTAITVTSKGFIYMGSYPSSTDLSNLASVADAPDYSAQGDGFPIIGKEAEPRGVISFMHSIGQAIAATNVANFGAGSCLSGTGSCVLSSVSWEIMTPVAGYTTITKVGGKTLSQVVSVSPKNSVGTVADGFRFVILAKQLSDVTGVTSEVIIVLYTSGLIEMFYYQISQSSFTASYDNPTMEGYCSVGIQGMIGGTAVHYSTPSNVQSGWSVSQQPYSAFSSQMSMTGISFRPV